MKILKLDIENYKKIRAFNCNLEGNNLLVAGKPDEGKTTAVSALWELLESKQDALRHGAKSGHIKITLGDSDNQNVIECERKITPKTNTITIKDANGNKVDKKTIQSLLNAISSDPLALMQLKGMELTKFLLKCVTLPAGVDIETLDERRADLEPKRLIAKRVSESDEKLTGPEPEKCEAVDIDALAKKVEEIDSAKGILTTYKEQLRNKTTEAENNLRSIEKMKKEISDLQFRNSSIEDECNELGMVIMNTEASIDDISGGSQEELKNTYHSAVAINSKHEAWESWNKRHAQANASFREWVRIDNEIKKIDATKKNAMLCAKYPVEGLTIAEDGKVYYQGNLLENCGTEKQMLVSTALVASQINGIKAMRIDRAESMGSDGRAKLIEICRNLGVQVCMSRVTDGEPDADEIRITEGVYEQ